MRKDFVRHGVLCWFCCRELPCDNRMNHEGRGEKRASKPEEAK